MGTGSSQPGEIIGIQERTCVHDIVYMYTVSFAALMPLAGRPRGHKKEASK